MSDKSALLARLQVIEAEYLAYATLTPEKRAALEELISQSGFQDCWQGTADKVDADFAAWVKQALRKMQQNA